MLQVRPESLVVGVPTEAPVTVGESEKLEAVMPVTCVSSTRLQLTVAALLGVASARSSETIDAGT